MVRFLVLLLIVVAVVAALVALLRARSSSAVAGTPDTASAEVMATLRARALQGSAAEFSIEPADTAWGVLMEIGFPEGAATVVALGDGSASIYFSSGGGVIGGGPHPEVNAAARRLVALAAGHHSTMTPTSEHPLPGTGDVTFYLLTTEGVLTAGAREDVLEAGDHSLSELYAAGHDVITGLRERSEEGGT